MEILNGETGFVLFADLLKDINSRTPDFWSVSYRLKQQYKMKGNRWWYVGTKTEGHLLSIFQYCMKRTQKRIWFQTKHDVMMEPDRIEFKKNKINLEIKTPQPISVSNMRILLLYLITLLTTRICINLTST